jgi:hypothetical protein
MKIAKFNENLEKQYLLFTILDEDGGSNVLFNSYEIAMNYMITKIYKAIGNKEKKLNKFEKLNIDNLYELFDYYDELVDNNDNLSRIIYDDIEVTNEIDFVDDWIELRLNAKKYNL